MFGFVSLNFESFYHVCIFMISTGFNLACFSVLRDFSQFGHVHKNLVILACLSAVQDTKLLLMH